MAEDLLSLEDKIRLPVLHLHLLRLPRVFKMTLPVNTRSRLLLLKHLLVSLESCDFEFVLNKCSFLSPIVPEPRHPLGGLKRLGTVMNSRRKSIAQPGGSFFMDKKNRSPFASFKRGDSRDMQIPESPPPGADRPDTAFTTQDSFSETQRNQSESRDREGLGAVISTSPEPQSAPTATNGAAPQETLAPFPGATPTAPTNEVCWKLERICCSLGG